MGRVRVLPPDLASQIAAGEVVERPASAIKELLENALDAGASRCDVSVDGGGISRLSVTDDGCGMLEEDARLALERHATSKLREFEDLKRLATFGFRGEALPTIASVSRFNLWTRTRESDAGVHVIVEGGAPAQVRPTGCAVGTRVEVRDLFFNVPARRKFLRSSGTEAGHVTELVEAVALGRCDVTFTLERDGRRVREWLRAGSRAERVQQALPEDELAECQGERGPLQVQAFLSRPERARTGAGALRVFVNGRWVRDRALAATVAQAYGSVLERGRYPRGVVYLDVQPELVDVNVHPQKSEVRFADPRAVTDAVFSILSRALSQAFALPRASRGAWSNPATPPASAFPAPTRSVMTTPEAPRDEGVAAPTLPPLEVSTPLRSTPGAPPAAPPRVHDPLPTRGDDPRASAARHATASALERSEHTSSRPEPSGSAATPPPPLDAGARGAEPLLFFDAAVQPNPRSSGEPRWSGLRFVAQLRQTYLVCENAEGLYILDQHAAAERVTFARLRHEYQSREVASQALLFPVTLQVSADDVELVEQRAEQIAQVGLELRTRGHDTLSIHAVPKLLARARPEQLARDLLHELGRLGGRAFSDAVDLALATMACHGSVRAGDPLTPEAVTALLQALDGAEFAGFCPHGRPIVTFTSWGELERRVGRR